MLLCLTFVEEQYFLNNFLSSYLKTTDYIIASMDILLLFKVGFLGIRIWDVFDILIVGYLLYQIYNLLKGSLAYNIFIGVFLLYILYAIVGLLKMELLSLFLGEVVSMGVLSLVVIFQPEIRRFLLMLGRSTIGIRAQNFITGMTPHMELTAQQERHIGALKAAIIKLSKIKSGALIVFARNIDLEGVITGGISLDAEITAFLIETIFNKEGPLHDGAVIIDNGRIKKASCILPLTEKDMSKRDGLRHRAAMGLSERVSVAIFVVSEETGKISFVFEGKIDRRLSEAKLEELLKKYYI